MYAIPQKINPNTIINVKKLLTDGIKSLVKELIFKVELLPIKLIEKLSEVILSLIPLIFSIATFR